jgi:hypothetical protein
MQTNVLIFVPGMDSVLTERLALFLAFDLLADSLPHHPVRGMVTRFGKTLYALTRVWVYFDRYHCRASRGGSRGTLRVVSMSITLSQIKQREPARPDRT